MKTPEQVLDRIRSVWKKEYTLAFLTTILLGLAVHMPILVKDIPNHDGLDSLYFDQNMITSGRWFLTVACGISSYFSLPWVTGMLALLYLGLASACLTEVLGLKSKPGICIVSGLLVSFPALASSFAYVYTLDGYMMALLFAIAAVMVTQKWQKGYLAGAVFLSCSLGTYQAYLPVSILLCLYLLVITVLDTGSMKETFKKALGLLKMGILAVVIHFGMLYGLLFLQGKQLAGYQGINGEGTGNGGILASLKLVYVDFLEFLFKGKVLFNNLFSAVAFCLLGLAFLWCLVCLARRKGLYKKPGFYGWLIGLGLCIPLVVNYILILSQKLNYHLIMKYQWVFLLILVVAFMERYGKAAEQWAILVCGGILIFNFLLTDNIGYENLNKKYEKTYAYCVRLLDRIENTPGYYQGIPIAMIGVVGDESYPDTDLSAEVTWPMIGLNGNWLLYTGENYARFIKYYLGASLNILDPDCMESIYYSKVYQDMGSFPGPDSTKVVDGILYVHTENVDHTLQFEE